MDFTDCIYQDIERRTCFCIIPSQNGKFEHKFTLGTWYVSIIMEKEDEKKSVIIMFSWKVYRGTILLYEILPETLQHECSERKNINSSVIMRFHYIWWSQETGGCMVSFKNYGTVRYLGHHPCSKLVLTIKLCYSWKALLLFSWWEIMASHLRLSIKQTGN